MLTVTTQIGPEAQPETSQIGPEGQPETSSGPRRRQGEVVDGGRASRKPGVCRYFRKALEGRQKSDTT